MINICQFIFIYFAIQKYDKCGYHMVRSRFLIMIHNDPGNSTQDMVMLK